MQKIEASKLLTKIFNKELYSEQSVIVLSDDIVFQKCINDMLLKNKEKHPKIFQGAHSIFQYNQYIRQNNLFEPVCDALIILDEHTSKKTLEEKIMFHENIVFILGKTNLRNLIDSKKFSASSFYLCYSPNDFDRQKCAEILIKQYVDLTKLDLQQIAVMAEESLKYYHNDLYHCVLHYERMKKSGLSFDNAKLLDKSISGNDIIHTLLEGNLNLFDHTLHQHAINENEPSSILNTVIYFFKQLAHVHSALSETSNLNDALLKAKIPYPAQNNVKKGIQKISYQKIEHFFSICANIECNLRESKNPYQYLFLELSQLNLTDLV